MMSVMSVIFHYVPLFLARAFCELSGNPSNGEIRAMEVNRDNGGSLTPLTSSTGRKHVRSVLWRRGRIFVFQHGTDAVSLEGVGGSNLCRGAL